MSVRKIQNNLKQVKEKWESDPDQIIDLIKKLFDDIKGDVWERGQVLDLFIRYIRINIRKICNNESFTDRAGLNKKEKLFGPKQYKNPEVSINSLLMADFKVSAIYEWLVFKKVELMSELNLEFNKIIFEGRQWIDESYRIDYLNELIKSYDDDLEVMTLKNGNVNLLFAINHAYRQGTRPSVYNNDIDDIIITRTSIIIRKYLKEMLNGLSIKPGQEPILIQSTIELQDSVKGDIHINIPVEKIVNALSSKGLSQEKASPAIHDLGANTLLTRKETAQLLKISLQTLYEWTKAGKIKANRAGKNSVRYRREDIEQAIKGISVYKFR